MVETMMEITNHQVPSSLFSALMDSLQLLDGILHLVLDLHVSTNGPLLRYKELKLILVEFIVMLP